MTSTTDRARLIGFVTTNVFSRLRSRLANMFAAGLPFDGRAPARLLIAPHDLRTADPTIAADIYRGRFSLSGSAVDIGATSPFMLNPPTQGWQEELLSFSWLRHLHAADDAVSRVHARALIGDWITSHGRDHPVAWRPEILARRIIAWLAHSPLYLTNAEPEFYRAVMRSLGRQLRHLARTAQSAPDGVPRLTAVIAMTYATLCISGLERLQARAVRLLSAELKRQVLPDGGHISRNPGAILDLLLDLLPLRQTFIGRDLVPPPELLGAIDRMMPMVRFFRHGDGGFALFNGMGRTPIGAVSAVLAYDETRGRPPEEARHSGYQRLEAGRTTLLLDAGRPPPTSVSHEAHAGCLSVEVSIDKHRVITNCGTTVGLRDEWRQAARTTAAHSSLVVADASSCRFITGGALRDLMGTPIVSGPREVPSARFDTDEELVVEARHDGYRRLGLIHHRRLTLSRDGSELEGQDRLTRSKTLFSRTRPYAIRFHLHPNIKPTFAQNGRSVILSLPGTEAWRFSVFGAGLRIEESVYLADPKGARRTSQIVISGQCGNETMIRWSLRKGLGERAPRVREVREGEREEQILPAPIDPAGEAPEQTPPADTPGEPAPPQEPEPQPEPKPEPQPERRPEPQPEPPAPAEPEPAEASAPDQPEEMQAASEPAKEEPPKPAPSGRRTGSLFAALRRGAARPEAPPEPQAEDEGTAGKQASEPDQTEAALEPDAVQSGLSDGDGPDLVAAETQEPAGADPGDLDDQAQEADEPTLPDAPEPEAEPKPASRRSRLAAIFGRRANFKAVPDEERAPRHRESDPSLSETPEDAPDRQEPTLGGPRDGDTDQPDDRPGRLEPDLSTGEPNVDEPGTAKPGTAKQKDDPDGSSR